jgi:pyridoxamine 5'-phosphate oxidase
MDAADLDPDPFVQFARWLDDVLAEGLAEPYAMVVATASTDGQPVGRFVLLRGHGPDGFVFFTNYHSRKGRQLEANPQASLTFPWHPMHRQVIVTGSVERTSAAESDAYFASRDRESQIGAWASDQSAEIPDRAWLLDRVAGYEAQFAGTEVPRPPHWGGFRVVPDAIELWQQGPNRLHDRFRYARTGDTWRLSRLSP